MWRKPEDSNAASNPSSSSAAREESPSAAVPAAEAAKTSHTPREATPVASHPVASHLTGSLLIKGEITGSEDLFIDGELQGKIRLEDGRVTVGEKGRVSADVEAREIVIRGKVKGKMHGRERLQVGVTGQADGDMLTPRILIEDGAEIHGRVEITRAQDHDHQADGAPNGKPKGVHVEMGGFALPSQGAN